MCIIYIYNIKYAKIKSDACSYMSGPAPFRIRTYPISDRIFGHKQYFFDRRELGRLKTDSDRTYVNTYI